MSYSEDEVLEILKDDTKIDEFFSKLTGEDVKRYLIYVNSKIRNIPYTENGIYQGTMVANSLVSPNNDIQNRYFDKIANALANVQGRKNKATMMYYLINELHLFEDANGRTSRCIFEIINNKNFVFENNDNFVHRENGIAKINHNEFEMQNNIASSTGIELYANYYLYKALIQKGVIPNTHNYTEKIVVITDADSLLETNVNNGSHIVNNPVYISDEVKEQLSKAQIAQIQNAFADNNGALITTSGLTMLTILLNNETIKDFQDFTYADGKMFCFPVDKDSEDRDKILGEFQKEDFFKAVNIYNLLKESMLDMIVDFFKYPENFIVDGQLNMKEALTTNYNILHECDYTVLEALKQTASLETSDTQTEKNIEKLSNIIRQISIQDNSAISTENIGRQVITEMSDVILEDETEQEINRNERDIQKNFENSEDEQQL